MDKLRFQAKAIRDAAIGELLRQMRYKAEWYGTLIVEAGRFFPSSKLCSRCGYHHAGLKREAHWTCPECGSRHERNENAALNLLGLALKAVDELPDQLILGPVGPYITLPDAKALTGGNCAAGETGPGEGRTAPLTQPPAAVDGGVARNPGNRRKANIQTQPRLAI